MKILIVDDERQLVSAVSTFLKQKKYSVDVAYNGEEGLDMALTSLYDVIILDVMMPKLDGISLLKLLRKNKITTPVIILSAKGEVADKIVGLESGADDYLAKPFNINELVARIRALSRRTPSINEDVLSFGDLCLDRNTYKISKNEKSISLGKKEFQILEMLMLNKGKLINKERFIEKIWGYDTDAEYNTVEVYVSFLRKKLLAIDCSTEIKSIRGIGYTLGDKNG